MFFRNRSWINGLILDESAIEILIEILGKCTYDKGKIAELKPMTLEDLGAIFPTAAKTIWRSFQFPHPGGGKIIRISAKRVLDAFAMPTHLHTIFENVIQKRFPTMKVEDISLNPEIARLLFAHLLLICTVFKNRDGSANLFFLYNNRTIEFTGIELPIAGLRQNQKKIVHLGAIIASPNSLVGFNFKEYSWTVRKMLEIDPVIQEIVRTIVRIYRGKIDCRIFSNQCTEQVIHGS